MRLALLVLAVLVGWIAFDLIAAGRHDPRDFDPHDVAGAETEMWRSYYARQPVRLFVQLAGLLRRQFHLSFWRANLAAYRAARAARTFQAGRNRDEYLRALPDLRRYYSAILRASTSPFDVNRVAALELEWWIVHRERARHAPGDLERALAALQAEIYSRPPALFEEHARYRAEAMRIRDTHADWPRIGELLDRSWVAARLSLEGRSAGSVAPPQAMPPPH